MIKIISEHWMEFWVGLRTTLMLCGCVWGLGLVLGTILGVSAGRFRRALGWPVNTLAVTLAGIPIIVWLFWLHYPAQYMLHVVIDPRVTSIVALSILNIIWVADIWRRSYVACPKQYTLAAIVTGLSPATTAWRITFPIIARHALPAILIVQMNMLHASLFTSFISVDELFRAAQRLNSQIYKPVEIYSALAIFFMAVTVPVYVFAGSIQRRVGRDYSEV
jgi:polar amino acid transport system permease protein